MTSSTEEIKCRHTHGDFLYYKLVTLVPFVAALMAIGQQSVLWLGIYLGWIALHVVVVYRLLCTHCPHCAADNGHTNCHFIWYGPPVFRARPGPLNLAAKLGLVVMLTLSSLFPLPWLIGRPELLVLYVLSLGVLFATMMKYECPRCSHETCPKKQMLRGMKQQ